jgi:hypothetical protein
VHLEASTEPHVHQKFEIFWTNIASTMACPNFSNGPKKGLGPLGVKFLKHQPHHKMLHELNSTLKIESFLLAQI